MFASYRRLTMERLSHTCERCHVPLNFMFWHVREDAPASVLSH